MQGLTKRQMFWKHHLDALGRFDGTAVEYGRQHDLDVRALYVYKGRLVNINIKLTLCLPIVRLA